MPIVPEPVASATTIATPKKRSQKTPSRIIQRSYSVIDSRIANILLPDPHGNHA
jgi:hypothetical protein